LNCFRFRSDERIARGGASRRAKKKKKGSSTMRAKLTTAALSLAVIGSLAVSSTPSEAKLTCKNVGKRWQICGDAKPFKSFMLGAGIRFNQKQPGLTTGAPE
jgi:hypothetical protein